MAIQWLLSGHKLINWGTVMRLVKHLLLEPFVHFLALGALIFLAYGLVVPETVRQDDTVILVTTDRVEQLKAGFKRVRLRDPTEAELKGLIGEHLKQEVLYRSALELGLERNDPVIRNRLRYKLEFLADSGAQLLDPADDVLAAFLAEKPDAYQSAARYSFYQIFLGTNPTADQVDSVKQSAVKIGTGSGIENLGQRTLLPIQLNNATSREIGAKFGKNFAPAFSEVPVKKWFGPVISGFGKHLVYIAQMTPGRLPALAEVRDAVLRDWQVQRASEIREAQYQSLLKNFRIEYADGVVK